MTDGPAGVLVGMVGGTVPEIAHPSVLHLAGTSADGRLAALVSDERLARRLRALSGTTRAVWAARTPRMAASGRSTPASSTRPADSRVPRSARTPARVTASRTALAP